jgi:hypothetical protein
MEEVQAWQEDVCEYNARMAFLYQMPEENGEMDTSGQRDSTKPAQPSEEGGFETACATDPGDLNEDMENSQSHAEQNLQCPPSPPLSTRSGICTGDGIVAAGRKEVFNRVAETRAWAARAERERARKLRQLTGPDDLTKRLRQITGDDEISLSSVSEGSPVLKRGRIAPVSCRKLFRKSKKIKYIV